MKHFLSFCLLLSSFLALNAQSNELAFQPYNTQGDNLIHINTADFDGIEDVINKTLKVYPNPASHVLNIELSDNFHEDAPIVIFDGLGRVVRKKVLQGKQAKVDVSSWTPGIYFLREMNGNATEKIIIK